MLSFQFINGLHYLIFGIFLAYFTLIDCITFGEGYEHANPNQILYLKRGCSQGLCKEKQFAITYGSHIRKQCFDHSFVECNATLKFSSLVPFLCKKKLEFPPMVLKSKAPLYDKSSHGPKNLIDLSEDIYKT